VRGAVADAWGANWGVTMWYMTLLCGFLVLAPAMATSADGIVRRWVDVIWTSSAVLRRFDAKHIKTLYFGVLLGYMCIGLVMLALGKPLALLKIATNIMNFALGFSCFHTLVINHLLLPKALAAGLVCKLGLTGAGVFFCRWRRSRRSRLCDHISRLAWSKTAHFAATGRRPCCRHWPPPIPFGHCRGNFRHLPGCLKATIARMGFGSRGGGKPSSFGTRSCLDVHEIVWHHLRCDLCRAGRERTAGHDALAQQDGAKADKVAAEKTDNPLPLNKVVMFTRAWAFSSTAASRGQCQG